MNLLYFVVCIIAGYLDKNDLSWVNHCSKTIISAQIIIVIRCYLMLILTGTCIIIIIMSRRLRGYPWPSLAISPYHSSPPAGLQDYNPCPHIAAVCKFVLVVPHLHIHEWGSTGVHRLWARPCFSSSVLRVWFVELV